MLFSKRGQAGLDYLVISVVIFFLLAPTAYFFLKPVFLTPLGLTNVMDGSVKESSNQDLVETIAEATRTVARINRPGTGMEFTVHKFGIASNTFKDGRVSVTTHGGDVFETGNAAPHVYAHRTTLRGHGFSIVRVKKTYLGAIGIGNEPILVGVCQEDVEYPTLNKCDVTSFPTNEGVYIVGTGLGDVTVAYLAKLSSGNKPPKTIPTCENPECTQNNECSTVCITDSCVCSDHSLSLPACTDEDCDLRRFFPQSGTGVGHYFIAVADPTGVQSNSMLIQMTPSN